MYIYYIHTYIYIYVCIIKNEYAYAIFSCNRTRAYYNQDASQPPPHEPEIHPCRKQKYRRTASMTFARTTGAFEVAAVSDTIGKTYEYARSTYIYVEILSRSPPDRHFGCERRTNTQRDTFCVARQTPQKIQQLNNRNRTKKCDGKKAHDMRASHAHSHPIHTQSQVLRRIEMHTKNPTQSHCCCCYQVNAQTRAQGARIKP